MSKGRLTQQAMRESGNGFPPGISLKDYALTDYIPEIEEQIRDVMLNSDTFPRNEKLYKRVHTPEFANEKEETYWNREEINRCINGHDGLNGKMYFWFNYCKIISPSGKIYPEYRVADHKWFDLLVEAEGSKKYGIICVKRRRAGFSWKEAADALHDVSFNSYYNVGMNSMSEKDSVALFSKVKFLYDNLPTFLKATSTAHNTKQGMHFSYHDKDKMGNVVTKGNQSEIIVKAPTSSTFEGLMLQKWISDESGKIKNLAQLYTYTEPCLMEETARVGVPIIFGTAGEIAKEGRDFKEMWDNSSVYNLHRFFFAAWMGLNVDKYGNDLKEESIRWVLYERYKKRNLDAKKLIDFIQQYPLDLEEAFSASDGTGVGNVMNINKQITSLRENPPAASRGMFKEDMEGNITWQPSVTGTGIMYEPAKPYLEYLGGCDPADHDDVLKEASDLSMYYMNKPNGLEKPRIVYEYTDRPNKLNEYYEQSILASIYYNEGKLLIENNRYRMIAFYEDEGYKKLLALAPTSILRRFASKVTNNLGVRMTPPMKEYLEGLIHEYTDHDSEDIPSIGLLEEFLEYGAVNTDKVMAFGICLIHLKESRSKKTTPEEKKKMTPSFGYHRTGKGKIKRIK